MLKVGAIELRLVAHVPAKGTGTWTGTLDSIDQGAKGIPIDKIEFEKGRVRLEFKKLKAVFEGKLKADGSTIEGEWKQGTLPCR